MYNFQLGFNQYVSFADAIIFSLKTSFSDFHRILFLPLQIKKVYTNNTIYERAIVTGLTYVSYLSQTNNLSNYTILFIVLKYSYVLV